MKIVSFCHTKGIKPAALLCGIAKTFNIPLADAIANTTPEGEEWNALTESIERDSLSPDPRSVLDPEGHPYTDTITDMHCVERAVYVVPINTDTGNAFARALLLSSVEDIELGQEVWGWDGAQLGLIIKASDAECEA